jgi:hypothetical protein
MMRVWRWVHDSVQITGVIRAPEWKDDFDNARQERTLAAVACTPLTQPYNGKELLSVVGLPSLPPWEPFLTRC